MKNYLFLAIQLLATLAYSQKYYVNEDFNNSTLPSGWTNNAVSGTQVWNFGINGASAHQGNQNINGSPMAYFDDDNLGGSSLNNTVELTTPTFDNSAAPYSYLSFQYNFREFGQANDAFYIDVYDGSQWQRVFTRTVDDCGNYNSWICINNFPSARIDISAYANANCQVRFTYHDGNDWGWYVGLDDVEIWSPYANDLSVIDVKSPKSSCGLSTADSIKVLISNQGYLTQQNFNIAFELDGSPAVVENITDSIAYQDSLIYTFSNTGNFSRIGLHNLKVYTTLPNDSNLTNDSLSIQISNDSIYQLPYFNDFEITNNGWSTSGTNTSWEWGVPTGSVIDSAYSGQNAWVTNLNGTYNRSEFSYLLSPCFDFSNETADPIISFYLNYITELNYDKVWLESSIDNEQTWQKVNSTTFANNWYNIANRQTWERASNGWVKATNVLGNLAGEPRVKLRFVFESDGGTQLEGVGIDDITIQHRQRKELKIEQIKSPSTSSLNCGYGSVERFVINLKNYGYTSIDTFQLFYQIDSLAIDSETVIINIDTLSLYKHISKLTFNFSQQKNYNIKCWTKIVGDTSQFNDTLVYSFNNSNAYSSHSLPYTESFDDFVYVAANQFGWTTNPISGSVASFGWRASSGSMHSSTLTGPSNDHLSGKGTFIYLETSQNGNDAVFESPCFDFTNANGAVLSFWFFRYGTQVQPLHIDYYDGLNWINIDTITQKPQLFSVSPWTYHEIFLPLGGLNTKIRFRGSSQGSMGDVAIDDLKIETGEIDLKNFSNTRSCQMNDKLEIKVQLKNYSLSNLAADSIYISYAIDNNTIALDTISQPIASNTSYIHTFADSIDLNQHANQFEVKIIVRYSDTSHIAPAEMSFIYHKSAALTDLTEDFESHELNYYYSKIWHFNEHWRLINDTVNNNLNFPRYNKTPGGNQFFRTSRDGVGPQLEATMESKCIDISQVDSLYLTFWYTHSGREIYLYTHNNGTNIQIIDSITPVYTREWKRAMFNLTPYLNSSSLEIGLKVIHYSAYFDPLFAIDDIQLISEPPPYNLRAKELSINQNCNNASADIDFTIENNGLDSIISTQFNIYYQLDNNAVVADSFTTSIAATASYTHRFSGAPTNLTANQNYEIKAWMEKSGDSLKYDDSLQTTFNFTGIRDSLKEDFESFEDVVCYSGYKDQFKNGWYSPNQTWAVRNLKKCFSFPMDHNSDSGTYISVDYYNSINNGKLATLYSPCVDISSMSQPVLTFWLYKFELVATLDTMRVEILSNGTWQLIDTTTGYLQNGVNYPWTKKTVDLTPFKNSSPIQLRFTKMIRGSSYEVIALDDISIADSLITSRPENISEVENYHLYPNPSQGQFTLEVDQIFLGELYQIRELSGKLVQEGRINSNTNHIQLNDKAKGIYFLSIPNMNVQEKVVVY